MTPDSPNFDDILYSEECLSSSEESAGSDYGDLDCEPDEYLHVMHDMATVVHHKFVPQRTLQTSYMKFEAPYEPDHAAWEQATPTFPWDKEFYTATRTIQFFYSFRTEMGKNLFQSKFRASLDRMEPSDVMYTTLNYKKMTVNDVVCALAEMDQYKDHLPQEDEGGKAAFKPKCLILFINVGLSASNGKNFEDKVKAHSAGKPVDQWVTRGLFQDARFWENLENFMNDDLRSTKFKGARIQPQCVRPIIFANQMPLQGPTFVHTGVDRLIGNVFELYEDAQRIKRARQCTACDAFLRRAHENNREANKQQAADRDAKAAALYLSDTTTCHQKFEAWMAANSYVVDWTTRKATWMRYEDLGRHARLLFDFTMKGGPSSTPVLSVLIREWYGARAVHSRQETKHGKKTKRLCMAIVKANSSSGVGPSSSNS